MENGNHLPESVIVVSDVPNSADELAGSRLHRYLGKNASLDPSPPLSPTEGNESISTTNGTSATIPPGLASGFTNLFINGLPPTLTDEMLLSWFQPFGDVESAKVMVDLGTGQSRGFGFVKFATPAQAGFAMSEMNDKILPGGKKLSVKWAESEGFNPYPFGTPSENIHVKGLPPQLTEEQVIQLFSSYGSVTKHGMMKDKTTGLYNGQAFISFATAESAHNAISALNGYVFPGNSKPIIVRYADTEKEKLQKRQKALRHQQQVGATARVTVHPYARLPISSYPQSSFTAYQPFGFNPPTEANLYVSNLPANADDAMLYRLFSPFGAIKRVAIIKDKSTNSPKGFGFVTMVDYNAALNAIQALSAVELEGKRLRVAFSQKK